MCRLFFLSLYLGGLNISSSQLPDNRSIKGFVEAYVDKLISRYPVTYHTMNFCIDFKRAFSFHDYGVTLFLQPNISFVVLVF